MDFLLVWFVVYVSVVTVFFLMRPVTCNIYLSPPTFSIAAVHLFSISLSYIRGKNKSMPENQCSIDKYNPSYASNLLHPTWFDTDDITRAILQTLKCSLLRHIMLS